MTLHLHIEVTPVSVEQMTSDRKAESSIVIREPVIRIAKFRRPVSRKLMAFTPMP
jgi:hypothetical protein